MQPWKFYHWLKQYRKQKVKLEKPTPAGKFVKLNAQPRTFNGGVYAEVVFPGGTSVRFHQQVSSAELKQLARL